MKYILALLVLAACTTQERPVDSSKASTMIVATDTPTTPAPVYDTAAQINPTRPIYTAPLGFAPARPRVVTKVVHDTVVKHDTVTIHDPVKFDNTDWVSKTSYDKCEAQKNEAISIASDLIKDFKSRLKQ